MTPSQIKEAELISNTLAQGNKTVYTQVVSLAQAKAVQGLRAVFDEVHSLQYSVFLFHCPKQWRPGAESDGDVHYIQHSVFSSC